MEIEYKWKLPEGTSQARLLQMVDKEEQLSQVNKLHMHAIYYDTPDGAVARLHGGLRLRRENEKSVCCLKLAAIGADGCKTREEYEVEAQTIEEGLAKLPLAGAPHDICEELVSGQPVPECETEFDRLAYTLCAGADDDAFQAELAIDRGALRRAEGEAPISEVELEFKAGSQEAFHTFAATYAKANKLEVEPLSKLARAMSL